MNHFWEVVLIVVAVVLILAILVVLMCTLGTSTFDREEWKEIEYCVCYGDTLWNIGEFCCPNTVDIRDWINEVKALNNMRSSTLKEGQVIRIYVLAGED
jgi:hypothetical protein